MGKTVRLPPRSPQRWGRTQLLPPGSSPGSPSPAELSNQAVHVNYRLKRQVTCQLGTMTGPSRFPHRKPRTSAGGGWIPPFPRPCREPVSPMPTSSVHQPRPLLVLAAGHSSPLLWLVTNPEARARCPAGAAAGVALGATGDGGFGCPGTPCRGVRAGGHTRGDGDGGGAAGGAGTAPSSRRWKIKLLP